MRRQWLGVGMAAIALGGTLPASGQGGIPVITSPLRVDGGIVVTQPDDNPDAVYYITASNSPTSFAFSGPQEYVSRDFISGSEIFFLQTDPALYTVTISATNAAGTGTATLLVAIHACVEWGVFSADYFAIGQTVTATVTFNGPVSVVGHPTLLVPELTPQTPLVLTYESGSGTNGLNFTHTVTAADGQWSINQALDQFSIDLNGGSITDANGLSAILFFPIPYGPVSDSYVQIDGTPLFQSNPPQSASVGTPFLYQIKATSGYTLGATGLPPGLSLDTATGTISGVPTTPGTYSVSLTASNAAGAHDSSTLTITVAGAADAGHLVNLSVLAPCGPGNQVLTLGFVSGAGSGTEPILVRGVGPSLAAFGVPNIAPDPYLTLFSGQSAIGSNDNWGVNQGAVAAADSATGAFALANPGSLDAALVASVAPGAYTVQIGVNGAAGNVLGEVYDDSSAAPGAPQLINLSCLYQVAPGSLVTAGFVVGGTTPCTVLLRASGPALATYGVTGYIPDPMLALHTTVNGHDSVLATNAGWGGAPALSAAFQSVGAFPYTSAASADSAILTTVNPGSYTVQATSASGAGGQVLVEIYTVP